MIPLHRPSAQPGTRAAPAARPWFLVSRLAWRLSAVTLVGVALGASAVAWRTLATISSVDDAALQSQARLVAEQLSTGPDGRPVLHLPAELEATFGRTDERAAFLVFDRAGHVLLASDPTTVPSVLAALDPPPWTGLFRAPPSPDYPNGMVGALIATRHWRVAVVQAHELNEGLARSLVRDFMFSTLWLLLPIGGATVLIGVLTIRHGLRSLRDASAAAAQVGRGQTGVRLPSAALPGEILPVVGAVNAALDRLEQALDAQRRFVADAAHALRTPLAVLTARIDELGDQREADDLRGDADRMARLVGQMLAMARLEELPLDVTAPVDLRAVAVAAVSEIAPLAISRGVELGLLDGPVVAPINGNAAALGIALANLLDNAIRHAPRGTAVEVAIEAPATIRVLDRGPGVPEAERSRIFARFHRAPGTRPGGAGLGLAIVAGIAAAHGGDAWVEAHAGGGAMFVMRLQPAAPRA
ncbi:MAG: HAMP domain-containing histidine kinase [Rhodospirillales bacterium]|nr:HAMP domain-containing histidine kinase [Rhodospirillales bacterium]